jgi:hypothetical protein
MNDRPSDDDPLLVAIREEVAKLSKEDLDPDLDDPALRELVDRAVAPWAPVLTPAGQEEARRVATAVLATHPDIDAVLERLRGQPKASSGVRPKRSPTLLQDAAARRGRRGGGAR